MSKNEIHCIHIPQAILICLIDLYLFCIHIEKSAKIQTLVLEPFNKCILLYTYSYICVIWHPLGSIGQILP